VVFEQNLTFTSCRKNKKYYVLHSANLNFVLSSLQLEMMGTQGSEKPINQKLQQFENYSHEFKTIEP
jgi:hypothetical protein